MDSKSAGYPLFKVGMVLSGQCSKVLKENLFVLELVAICDLQKSEDCIKFAKEMGIKFYGDFREMLKLKGMDLLLECSGDKRILPEILSLKPARLGVLDLQASMRFIELSKGYAANPLASVLLGASPDWVLVISSDFRILDCNEPAIIRGRYPRRELIGKHCYEVLCKGASPYLSPMGICVARQALKSGKAERSTYEFGGPDEVAQFRQVTAYPIFDRHGDIVQYVLTLRDMAQEFGEKIKERTEELKKDFARLAQEDRLSSLGRLVASVCHEINNPITSIVTFNKLIQNILKSGADYGLLGDTGIPKALRYLELSFKESMRCGAIVRNLLTFAKPKGLEAQPVSIRELVDSILILTEHQFQQSGITHEVRFPDTLLFVWGDLAQMQQCLLNLVFNAIDAMPGGGMLTIAGEIDEAADRIRISVTDTGCGIEPENLQRIFEPFYTTKSNGKGSGLGLPMVYGIVKEHGGKVQVESAPGEGATFRIILPRVSIENMEKGPSFRPPA